MRNSSSLDWLRFMHTPNDYRVSREDGEATIDGIHFTDLGMMRYADLVCPIIKKAIK